MFQRLRNIFGVEGDGSKRAAKNRLQFVLVQDRAGLSNEEMAVFRGEMMSVIEKYFDVDANGFNIEYTRENDTTTLRINSPVLMRKGTKALNATNGAAKRAGRHASAGDVKSGQQLQRGDTRPVPGAVLSPTTAGNE